MTGAYEAGIRAALEKLGGVVIPMEPMRARRAAQQAAQAAKAARSSMLTRAAGGAVAGGVGGYMLSPEDRKGYGVMLGGALGGAGAALGPHALDLMHNRVADPKTLTPAMRDGVGSVLGTTAGIGASQLFIDKRLPDSSEDPYRYTVG